MLSREMMGALALAILWVNTLLVAAAALKELASLLTLRRRLVPLVPGGTGVARARVVSAGGAIAVQRIEQIGRRAADVGGRPAITFADRTARGEVLGGSATLERDGREVTIEATEADVWLTPDELARAVACPSDAAFDAAFEDARKARGFVRTVDVDVAAGREVFVFGELRARDANENANENGGLVLSAAKNGGMIIAAFDPRAWLSRRIALAAAFVVGALTVAAAATGLALHSPPFGAASTVGGALCLAFFLLVQPAGTALRDAVRLPSRAPVRGRWVREEAASTQGAHAPEKG